MRRLLLTVFVVVVSYLLMPYADAHHRQAGDSTTISVSPSPTPSPQAAIPSEVLPTFAEVIIADQIRARSPEFSELQTVNVNARASHNVNDLQLEFPGLDGSDVEVAVFDNGRIRATHKEFRLDVNDESTSRIKFRMPPTGPFDPHATHVAGTLGAAGNIKEGRAKGMAPRLKAIYGESMREDLSGLEALNGIASISNHSYTPPAGWTKDNRSGRLVWYGNELADPNEDVKFGKYRVKEARLDELVYRSKKLLAFVAAGNDRNESPEEIIFETQPVDHFVYDFDANGQPKARLVQRQHRRPDGFDSNGLDTVVGLCVAKNSICVGAIPDIPSAAAATSLESIESASYSNWGPTDDGRIKPDLVATGNDLVSASETDDDALKHATGTSMATPTAAGIAALLVQLHRRERGDDPFAAVIKAVLIHTAMDAGKRGPDPVFGWGAIDALRAGRVIAQKERHIIMRRSVSTTSPTLELLLEPTNTNDQIKVTVVWTDPPAAANTGGLDDSSSTLINDLDLKLTAPDGTTIFLPYSLNARNPLAEALKDAPNRVDNVEVIEGVGSAPGKWKLEVTAASLKVGQDQDFAIVISGLRIPN